MLKIVQLSFMVAAVLATGACSTPKDPADPKPATTAAAATGTTAESAPGQLTGSRIPRKSSDRMIRGINAAGAKETMNELPPSPVPKVN